MAERTGLAAVLDEADAGEGVLAVSEQLSFVGLSAPQAEARRAGRPAGRRNLRNERVAMLLMARHGDPLEELLAMGMLPVDALAEALGVNKAAAVAEKRLLLGTVLPYMHSRQPIAVDFTGKQVVQLVIQEGEVGGVIAGDDDIVDIVDFQEVSDASQA